MSVRAMSWAWGQDLPGSDKLVLLALADHAGEDGTAYPGQARLAEKCGKTERRIRDSLARIEARGLVTRERRHRENGSQTSNLYHLSLPDETSGSSPSLQDASGRGGRPQTSGAIDATEPSTEPSGSQSPAREDGDEERDDEPTEDDLIERAVEFWKDATDRPGATATRKRRTHVRARLRAGYSIERIETAIAKAAASPWHRGDNPQRRRYDQLERICRSDEYLDEILELDERRAGQGAEAPETVALPESVPDELRPLWTRVVDQIYRELPEHSTSALWLDEVVPVELDADGTLRIGVPERSFSYVGRRYSELLGRAAMAEAKVRAVRLVATRRESG